MRILLINNSGQTFPLFEEYFRNHTLTILPYNNLRHIKEADFDCVLLSGSSNFPIVGNEVALQEEMDFIRTTTVPVLGICYGFELIVVALGGSLKRLEHKQQGVVRMDVLNQDPILEGVTDLFVYEGHRWAADNIPDSLQALTQSPHGIEGVKHVNRFMYGFQFHPEKLLRETSGGKILENFMFLVKKK